MEDLENSIKLYRQALDLSINSQMLFPLDLTIWERWRICGRPSHCTVMLLVSVLRAIHIAR
jgi:hypothetical protein